MKRLINSWAAWIFVRIQFMTSNFDLEVLQWPGGSLIAPVLSLCVTVRSFWSFGAEVSAQLQATVR
jgi:hypothetical protein